MPKDWLVGDDREARARARLYEAASDLIAKHGVDALDIDELARRAHCSRATVYRHVGGKQAIVEAVLVQRSGAIVQAVETEVAGISGNRRAAAAIREALAQIRADKVARQFVTADHAARSMTTVIESPTVLTIAGGLLGLAPDDTAAAGYAARSVFAMLLWPAVDADAESGLIERIVRGLG
ncbi:TetR/AcrR family transcriptional regulator [Gordonia sp. X0973]|nr:TetR/AcrR family transcriptional regulator [Gordonia sp. X0973]